MATVNPAVVQWIRQMADEDQAVANYASQSLLEEVLRAGKPGQEEVQAALASVLGEALVAEAKPGEGTGSRGADSFRGNVFLTSAAHKAADPLHPSRVRNQLVRMLGYLPVQAAVPYLAKALKDLEVRETARQALESNPAAAAADALIGAMDSAGPVFCAGVVTSLSKRKGERVIAALQKAAGDAHSEVRLAALEALACFAQSSLDPVLVKATRLATPREQRTAHIARARLAETLRAAGDKASAARIYKEILAGSAPEAQKKAARVFLDGAPST